MKQKSSLCDTVGLVVELLRHHLIEILQLLILEDLSMQSCNTVYGEACHDSEVSHLDLTVVNDSHLPNLLHITRILLLDLKDKSSVDLLGDLIDTRQKT